MVIRAIASCSFSTRLLWLAGALLMMVGCGGGGGGSSREPDRNNPPAPTRPNPIELSFRPVDLGTPNMPDGRDYRTPEFQVHHGLGAIAADRAYERGYFGQGTTIAITDDGMDITHPELADRIRAPYHVASQTDRVVEKNDGLGAGHGTYVAMLAAGARNNGSGEEFQIRIEGGEPIRSPNFHGVAPQASIIPIALSGGAHPPAAIRHAVTNGADAVNFSIGLSLNYWGEYAGREGIWLTSSLPLFGPLVDDRLRQQMTQVATEIEDSDTVMVWATGNEGWNSRNNEIRMCGKNHRHEEGCQLGEGPISAQEFIQNFTWTPDPDNPNHKIRFRDLWGTDCGSDDCTDYNSGGHWLEAPLFQPELLGKWMVVGALNRDGEIAEFSNGCGAVRNWCLMAPGESLTVGPDGDEIQGTSFAAPFVTGSLAVLKSRLPGMPMEVVQAVLLASAEPMGTRINNPREPDPVYGWGRLNLGNAVTMQGTVHLPYSVPGSATTREVRLQNARITLSPALAQMGESLRDVKVAVGGVGNAYYNVNLSDVTSIESRSHPVLGHAARDMLLPRRPVSVHNMSVEVGPNVGEYRSIGMDWSGDRLGRWQLNHNLCDHCSGSTWREWRTVESSDLTAAPSFVPAQGAVSLRMQGNGMRPFATVGSGWESGQIPWHQFGLRWWHRQDTVTSVAEFSRVDERHTIWGTRFGALGDTRTETLQGRLLLSAVLRENWQGFLGYERSSGQVFTSGRMVSDVSGLWAEGWSAGTQGRHVFRDDDTIRFSVRQEVGVRGGQARIDHLVATGSSFVDAFYRGHPQTLERRQTIVDLRTRPTTSYALGYSRLLVRGTQLAVALEYAGESREYGFSTRLQIDF